MTPLSPNTELYKQLKPLAAIVSRGVVLCIDPSIGSSSSQPAYAVYVAGICKHTGIGQLDSSLPLWRKSRNLYSLIRTWHTQHKPDVLVYEEIPDQRFLPFAGGRATATGNNVKAHATLLKAVGVTLAASTADHVVSISPRVWKARARSSYMKSDIGDAVELGYVVMELAKQLNVEPTRKRRSRKTDE